MGQSEELIVGLDIGTSKICAAVATVAEDGEPEIVGIGTAPSQGVRRGVVVDMSATVEAIRSAVSEAETAGGCEIHSVFAALSGSHIRSRNEIGILPLRGREARVADVKEVLEQAQTVAIPADHTVVHVVPQEYDLDEQEGIHSPLGMSGIRLTAHVHIVTATTVCTENLIKCCNRAGLHVVELVTASFAAAESVLGADERSLGAALVDIGGGTSDLCVYQQGAIRHTAVLPLGGNHLTNDVAYGLRTPFELAEQIKRRYGCANGRMLQSQSDLVLMPGTNDRPPRHISRKQLAEILEPRVEEILSRVRDELERTNLLNAIPCGLVVTGGSSALEGLPELASEIFEAPIRRGLPRLSCGLATSGLGSDVHGPELASAIGLALRGARHRETSTFLALERPSLRRLRDRLSGWLWSHPD